MNKAMFSYLGKLFKKAFCKKPDRKEAKLDEVLSPGQDSDKSKDTIGILEDNKIQKNEKSSKLQPKYYEGIRTQIKESGYSEERELVVGFDFGTSCSKVIIQDIVIRTCYAIPFDGLAIDRQGYFIPSQVSISENGVFSLEESDHLFHDMKIRMMESPEQVYEEEIDASLIVIEVAIAYIALVLQKAITWFLDRHQANYREIHILWQLNMGLPSRSYDDKLMCNKFYLAALAGWRAAVLNKEINVNSVKDSIKQSSTDLQIPDKVKAPVLHPDYVEIIPEVISEVIGYARSPLRNEGEHLLVDIGASTFDVSIFTLHSPEGEDCYSIWAAEVELFGCLKLHRKRISMANEIIDIELMKIDGFLNGMRPLPQIEDYFYKTTSGLDNVVREIRDKVDVPFFKKCKQLIYAVVINTKNNILPLSPCWKKRLPVFICGGGSYSTEYRKLIEECDLKAYGIPGFRVIELPKPEGLDAAGLHSGNYHRMAVAYGLSFSTDDIKEIIPPHVVAEDIIAERRGDNKSA